MRPVDDLLWIPVEDVSDAGRVRRAAMATAAGLGFDEHRAGEVGLAATELATNLQRHAVAGITVVRVRREDGAAGVELVAIDEGPGIADLDAVAVDGHSTGGTLGIGLGAVRRLASHYDAHSIPGRGTVVVGTFWPAGTGARGSGRSVAALSRPIGGEEVCGDAVAWAVAEDGVLTVMLADGLGHGPLAAKASQEAVRAFDASVAAGVVAPGDVLTAIHRALGGTRGAAVSVAQVDRAAERVRFAGVGNVAGWVDDGERRRGMIGFPGIVGHKRPPVRPMEYPLPPGALVVLHSDGLTEKWSLDPYPGIRRHDPLVTAATLMRDAGVRNDDASILVMGDG